jgi:hypothetical protein
MPIVNDIRATLDTALAAVSGLPAIAYENAPFEQVAGTPHLRVGFFVTSRRPAVRGPNPQHRYQGIYQVTVAVPSDTGTGDALDYADLIMTEFDGSSDLFYDQMSDALLAESGAYIALEGGGRILRGNVINVSIEYAELGTQVFSEPFFLVPVQIAWYVYGE